MKFELGPGMKCDLAVLMESRLLIQAQSGGGKSRTLRRLLEQTHGKVQQIVIDPEGEFSTLREQFDYVLAAGTGGDALAHPRTAAMLAERLLELQVSAIVDLYELKPRVRVEFVKLFLEALVEAPKRLRHPCIVAIDEAQMFAPEGGKAESAAAVADLAVRGRKRGLCLVAAVARLSEFDKATAAPLQNKLIGLTTLDLDMVRAAKDLGFDKAGMLGLRNLEAMQFWGFGPALVRAPTLVTIGPHVSTHLRPGARLTAVVPPPTDKIKALLPQLADLPAEAEQKQKTEADLRKDLAAARATITRLERAPASVPTGAASPAIAAELRQAHADLRELQTHTDSLYQALERLMKFIVEINAQDFFKAGGEKVDQAAIQKAIDGAAQQLLKLVEHDLVGRRKAFERWRQQGEQILASIGQLVKQDVKISVAVRHNEPYTVTPAPQAPRPARTPPPVDGEFRPSGPQQRILNALSWLETIGTGAGDKTQVALLADQSPTSSSYTNNVGALRTAGLIDYPGPGMVGLTDAGRAVADPGEVPSSSEQLHEIIYRKLSQPQAAILRALIAVYPDEIAKPELADRAGASATSSSYTNNLGTLRSLKLVDYTPMRGVVARPVLFLEARV